MSGEHRRNQLDLTRRRCHFYGKSGLLKALDSRFPLIHTGGNQCALIVNRLAPCIMELDGEYTDGGTCPVIVEVLLWSLEWRPR